METEPIPPDSHVRARMAPWRCLPAIWAQSMHPAQGHNWAFTTVVVWRSLVQNNFLCTSLCGQSPCRTATLVHYQLLTNLEARCEMEKKGPLLCQKQYTDLFFSVNILSQTQYLSHH